MFGPQNARQRYRELLVEEIGVGFEPQQHAGIEDGLARRLDQISKTLAALTRDQTVATETLALFVRYFLTATPPILENDQESARLVGRKRYEVFLAEIGRRVAEDRTLAAEVLQTIPIDQPDLFAALPGRQSLSPRSNGRAAGPGEANGHD